MSLTEYRNNIFLSFLKHEGNVSRRGRSLYIPSSDEEELTKKQCKVVNRTIEEAQL